MNYYHKKFLSSLSSADVLPLFTRYKGSAKEITESWGMLEAASVNFPNLKDYFIIVVGDGCSPRTGSLFAYFTKAEVLSIDPNFNENHWEEFIRKQKAIGQEVQRLTVVKNKVENMAIDCMGRKTIIVWPHSHADMRNVILFNCLERNDIAMPCCIPIPKMFLSQPHLHYVDYNIESEKRNVHIWKNTKVNKER